MKLFGEKFKTGINALIKREIENRKTNITQSSFNEEILHHAKHCSNLNNKTLLNNELYSKLEEYILDEKNDCPFLLTGLSGAGKSSLMGYVVKKVNT